jgi:Rhodopsin-like GPCR transmembrane domain
VEYRTTLSAFELIKMCYISSLSYCETDLPLGQLSIDTFSVCLCFQRNSNPLEHQFSFELHDIVELYAAFAIAYTFLLPVQLYALNIQRHALPFLLVLCMGLEYIGVVLNAVHFTKFAFDGSGVDVLRVVGNFLDMAAQVSHCDTNNSTFD